MYSPLYSADWSELFRVRVAQAEQHLRSLNLPTLEEYQAAVYQELNTIFSQGNRMTPLRLPAPGSPLLIDSIQGNVRSLNNDTDAILAQMISLSDSAARLLSLFAAAQTSLRQQVRELIYQPTNRQFVEAFISPQNLLRESAALDFGAGVATLPLVEEILSVPSSFRIGPASQGRLTEGSRLEHLLDNQAETVLSWEGESLELIFQFDTPVLLNRLKIEIDEYEGMTLAELTSTPDGSLREDILESVDVRFRQMDSSSGKYTGDTILDFQPRLVQQIRMKVVDRAGLRRIGLRSISFLGRKFQSQGLVQSLPIKFVPCVAKFTSKEQTARQYTSITHLLSEDGAHYRAIRPGELVELPATFYYRALLERIDATFDSDSGPLVAARDLQDTEQYQITGTSTVDLGSNIIERTINFAHASGQIALRDTPLPGTLSVYAGSMLASPEICVVSGNQLNFQYPVEAVVVKYQTSLLGPAGLRARKNHFTPLLYEIRFEKQA